MKKQLLLLSAIFALGLSPAFAQEPQQAAGQAASGDVKVHRVALGETMVIIAKKYMVLPQDIYELNPNAAEGLSAGMALRIPVGKKVKVQAEEKNLDYEIVDAATLRKQKERKQEEEKQVVASETKTKRTVAAKEETAVAVQTEKTGPAENISHEVRPGETLTSLAKKYNTTIADITAANAKVLKRGLQAGQTLVIPSSEGTLFEAVEAKTEVAAVAAPVTEKAVAVTNVPVKEETAATNPASHHVKSGETLHSLARKYNITVAEITAANEKMLKRGLQAGQTLVIPGGTTVVETAVATAEPVIVPNHASYSEEPTGNTEHKVESGETLHSLARKYNTTVDAITAANRQKLKRGLQAGQLIKIPVPIALAAHVNQQ